ncbi:MAG: J domain-containing protein [Chitinophagaceae bacterium]
MNLKDYYSILELPPSASSNEIKKAFRRLAHQYHPDKKNADFSHSKFSDIKEAYETLTNPVKKHNYLQQRWYAQSRGKKMMKETLTPDAILRQMLDLEKYVSGMDIHRMYHQGLYDQIISILSDENINTVNTLNDPGISNEIILIALKTSQALPYDFLLPVSLQLKKLDVADGPIKTKIDRFIIQQRQDQYWEKRKVWIVLLIAFLICLLIFLTGNLP